MKKAIKILERRQRKLQNKIIRKLNWLKAQYFSTPESSDIRNWISKAKEEIEELEKAVFYITQAEENLNKEALLAAEEKEEMANPESENY
jgi:hypothetical protein